MKYLFAYTKHHIKNVSLTEKSELFYFIYFLSIFFTDSINGRKKKKKTNRKGLYENTPIKCVTPAFRGYLCRHDGSCLFKNLCPKKKKKNLCPPAALRYESSAKTQTYLVLNSQN